MAVERIWLLDSGSLVIDRAHVMWNIDPGNPVRFPVYSVLIEHSEGLFLFDAGYDLELVEAKLPFELPEQTAEQTLPAQLGLCGFEPADVTAVINSHLHFDHVGGQKHLPNAEVWVHKEELRHARLPESFEALGYADRGFDHADAKFRWLAGEEIDFVEGMKLIFTPGHTIGHYSLLLEKAGRPPMFFIADVTYTSESWQLEKISGFHNDPTANVASIEKVKRIAGRTDAEVFFSHDMERWKTYKHAPDHY